MSTKNNNQQLQSTNDASLLASLIIGGDLSKLNEQQRVEYYQKFCDRLGVDPLTQPFKILKLNGKETLYCDKGGAQQLNKIHKVSHEIKAREVVSNCYVVTAQAGTPDGRKTESIGAVPIENLKGESLCNAMMKAETKAKRRATLDLLGLGMLDETETETIPEAKTVPFMQAEVSDDLDEWNTQINQCGSIDELTRFYTANKAVIDATPQILSLMTAKKQSLNKAA